MTELEKMQAFHTMEEIKNTPLWARDHVLVSMCRFDKTGQMERFARIFAAHKMPIDEIVPCIMDIMQDALVGIETDGKEAMK